MYVQEILYIFKQRVAIKPVQTVYKTAMKKAKSNKSREMEKNANQNITYYINSWKGHYLRVTVCPGSSDPPEKILNIFASENEVYTTIN